MRRVRRSVWTRALPTIVTPSIQVRAAYEVAGSPAPAIAVARDVRGIDDRAGKRQRVRVDVNEQRARDRPGELELTATGPNFWLIARVGEAMVRVEPHRRPCRRARAQQRTVEHAMAAGIERAAAQIERLDRDTRDQRIGRRERRSGGLTNRPSSRTVVSTAVVVELARHEPQRLGEPDDRPLPVGRAQVERPPDA